MNKLSKHKNQPGLKLVVSHTQEVVSSPVLRKQHAAICLGFPTLKYVTFFNKDLETSLEERSYTLV
jgi:hypothetical protein